MGEGRSERSGKRQRSSSHGVDKSCSDSELAQGKSRSRKSKSRQKWPSLLEGLTVDELSRYRRRRVQGQPKDNLGVNSEAEAENEDLVSEYREAFRARSEELLKESSWLERGKGSEDLPPRNLNEEQGCFGESEKKPAELPFENSNKGEASSTPIGEDKGTMESENAASELDPLRRSSLVRRNVNLRRGGDLYADTETYSSYVAYEGRHRPELARRPTSLKMEGDLDTTTEKCEKFIRWLNVSRPELMRVPTHLKLEGEFEATTENHEKYVPFVGVRRPELLRQNTNLKLEGESNFLPEYADVFKRHHGKERSQPMKPETHLRTGKSFFRGAENADNFADSSTKEAQANKNVATEEKGKQNVTNEKRRKDEEMHALVSKLEDLKAPRLEVPEYKDAYKDFPRERPKIVKPEDEIGRADGSKISSSSPTPKFATKIDQDPEYKSKYLDYNRDHPVYRKPPLISRSNFAPPLEHATRRQDCKRYDAEFTSEVRAQYVPYGRVPRVETLKMPANLRLEGNLDLEPEYRTAYCGNKRGNETQSERRMHRRRDRSLSASRRKENYWFNNAEQFGFANAAQDQDAFQILNTRVHEDVRGKPPSASRRGSKCSQTQAQTECNATKDRSASPTYRLHVCNVDDEPRGFQRRRSPSIQSSGGTRDPSVDRVVQNPMDPVRPYSPSFARSGKQQANGQSFVVLDNSGTFDRNKNEVRRRRTDRNCNANGVLPVCKRKSKSSTNWMPPWYDSTSTI